MEFSLPELGEGVYEAELVRWLVKPGDTVKHGQVLVEVLTDKATMEVPAPFAGTIQALNAEPGAPLKIGQVILSYAPGGQPEKPPPPKTGTKADGAATKKPSVARAASVSARPNGASATGVKAAPSVRYLARKLGVDLAGVHGSGPQGRVLIEDLSGYLERSPDKGQAAAKSKPEHVPMNLGRPGTRIKMQGLRRKIAEAMVHSKHTIPHYTYVDECDVTSLVQLRETLKEAYGRQGIKLTYLAFLVKAVVEALQEVPLVNASLDDTAGEMVLHDHYHIGIAVATPGGLIVPVIHDAERRDLCDIAREVERLSEDARAGKSKLDDLRGGTFTITSIGNLGGLFATPIILHPQVGILGVGKLVRRPVYDDHGQVRPADMMYLSFSFDHRLLDGAVGTVFGNAVMRRLRAPGALLVSPAGRLAD